FTEQGPVVPEEEFLALAATFCFAENFLCSLDSNRHNPCKSIRKRWAGKQEKVHNITGLRGPQNAILERAVLRHRRQQSGWERALLPAVPTKWTARRCDGPRQDPQSRKRIAARSNSTLADQPDAAGRRGYPPDAPREGWLPLGLPWGTDGGYHHGTGPDATCFGSWKALDPARLGVYDPQSRDRSTQGSD